MRFWTSSDLLVGVVAPVVCWLRSLRRGDESSDLGQQSGLPPHAPALARDAGEDGAGGKFEGAAVVFAGFRSE